VNLPNLRAGSKSDTLLAVEDDPDVRSSLRQTLEDEAFIVDAVDNGPEGLYRASEWKYDVIVLDVMLPEMKGWEVLEALRRKKNRTPVLMLTALDALDDRVRGLETGADDYLTKPFSDRELLARIRALHRRAVGQSDDMIDLGDVVLDTARRLVLLKGIPVELTANQYRIVVYLAERADTVVSRNDLSEAIIGEEDSAMSNVIEVQVYHIRRKLGKNFIRNKRGLGYVVPKS
jgi:two-component system OmpR family response regulator